MFDEVALAKEVKTDVTFWQIYLIKYFDKIILRKKSRHSNRKRSNWIAESESETAFMFRQKSFNQRFLQLFRIKNHALATRNIMKWDKERDRKTSEQIRKELENTVSVTKYYNIKIQDIYLDKKMAYEYKHEGYNIQDFETSRDFDYKPPQNG